MTHLDIEQTSLVETLLTVRGLEYAPLKEDLLDHICCQIEKQMAGGIAFEQALQNSMDAFRKDEIKDLQSQTLSLLKPKNPLL